MSATKQHPSKQPRSSAVAVALATKADHLNPALTWLDEEWPGSELKGQKNPYQEGSKESVEFERGQMEACLEAQDSEE